MMESIQSQADSPENFGAQCLSLVHCMRRPRESFVNLAVFNTVLLLDSQDRYLSFDLAFGAMDIAVRTYALVAAYSQDAHPYLYLMLGETNEECAQAAKRLIQLPAEWRLKRLPFEMLAELPDDQREWVGRTLFAPTAQGRKAVLAGVISARLPEMCG